MHRTRKDAGFDPIPSTGSLPQATGPTTEGHRSNPRPCEQRSQGRDAPGSSSAVRREDVPRTVVTSRFDRRFVSRISRDVRGCSWIPLIGPLPSKLRVRLPELVLAARHGSKPSPRIERSATRSSMIALGTTFTQSATRCASWNDTLYIGIPGLPFPKISRTDGRRAGIDLGDPNTFLQGFSVLEREEPVPRCAGVARLRPSWYPRTRG